MKRHSYTLSFNFDGIEIDELIIDQHYNLKHPEVDDWIILELVKSIENSTEINKVFSGDFTYYLFQPVFYNDKPYRLILILEKDRNYLGVVNAFRVKEK